MRQNRRADLGNPKAVARRHYNIRQMDKYIKWSFEVKGYLKWKDLVEQQTYNKIEVL
jgi:hypothetical protein